MGLVTNMLLACALLQHNFLFSHRVFAFTANHLPFPCCGSRYQLNLLRNNAISASSSRSLLVHQHINLGERDNVCRQRKSCLTCFQSKSDDVNSDDDESDGATDEIDISLDAGELEKVTQSLEKLLQTTSDSGTDSRQIFPSDIISQKKRPRDIPVLTSNRRKNMELEMLLLAMLDPENSNDTKHLLEKEGDVIASLWELWYGELGPLNYRKLVAIEQNLVNQNGPNSWPEAEKQYMKLIYEHCSRDYDGSDPSADGYKKYFNIDSYRDLDDLNLAKWIEPANRLATLYFLMGNYPKSKMWCERILFEKPWHFGALSGIVMVCLRMGDEVGAEKWAKRGLPLLSSSERKQRSSWVQKNMKIAMRKLKAMDRINKDAFRKADEDSKNAPTTNESGVPINEDSDDGAAWQ